jgi:predicted alpha/beta-hydrolase family hydrolase
MAIAGGGRLISGPSDRSRTGASASSLEVPTSRGTARVDLAGPRGRPRLLLALGHGAGGSIEAPDLITLRDYAVDAGVLVAAVTQPYRVAGRRAPAPAGHLDEAWVAAVTAVVAAPLTDCAAPGSFRPPLVVGGRSSGARVACRTAGALGAVAVVALAFPLHPPGRPERSRAGELATGLPTLVVTGDRDPFGVPGPGRDRVVVTVPGEDHALRRRPDLVATTVLAWLGSLGLLRGPGSTPGTCAT